MIDIYRTRTGVTPNVYKVVICAEELELPYRLTAVDITRGEQFRPEFLTISPNNKVPAIVDHQPADGGPPLAVFESGAILVYLADKAARLLPPTSQARARSEVLQWVFWQMAGLGPNAGQYGHYLLFAPERQPYAIARHKREVDRLIGVLNRRLQDRRFVAGDDYTIADTINFASVAMTYDQHDMVDHPERFPHFLRWIDDIRERPATKRAFDPARVPPDFGGDEYRDDALTMKMLYTQTSRFLEGELPTA